MPYLVEEQNATTLTTDYPHTPSNLDLSIQEYLEEKFDDNWTLVHVIGDGTMRFVFTKQ